MDVYKWDEISGIVHEAHGEIVSLSKFFSKTGVANLCIAYTIILQNFARRLGFEVSIEVKIDVSRGLSSHRETETARIQIKDRRIVLFVAESFFASELGGMVSSGPVYFLYLMLLASSQFEYPFGVFICEIGDCGYSRGVSFSSLNRESVLIPDLAFFLSGGYRDFRAAVSASQDWWTRAPKIVWRGSTSGFPTDPGPFNGESKWLPRLDLVKRVNDPKYAALCDVKLSNIIQSDDHSLLKYCSDNGLVGERIEQFDYSKFRYTFDIDGNSNAWSGLFCSLLAGCCVLKVKSQMGFEQWYYPRLVDRRNVIFIESDLRNLDEILLAIVDGGLSCGPVAEAGRDLARSMDFASEMYLAVGSIRSLISHGSI